ncbi:arylsulfatase B-like [Watersipora subatra]|uniref:arylsulfatase B-like n=1 Tax=Watersipora subatra TaxID=2589382 RepID=UPI00355C6BD9
MADDLGWNDVGFHNPKVRTPNIDALRAKGIELTQSYMSPVCSAPILEYGCQVWDPYKRYEVDQIEAVQRKAVRFICNVKGRDIGVTGLIKDMNLETLEERRTNLLEQGVMQRRVDGSANIDNIGTHLTLQDADDVEELILAHENDPSPLFMWITPTAPHDPLEVTDDMYNSHDFLDDTDPEQNLRRKYLGLVWALDHLVGVTMQALEDAGLSDNTIILFSSDNGGATPSVTFGGHEYYANAYPLRNGKNGYTDGGVRVPTVYYDPRLHPRTRGTSRDFLVHAVDWLPTLVQQAKKGRKSPNFKIDGQDGVSQLANLLSHYNCPKKRQYHIREEMLVALSDAPIDFTDISECATEDAAFRWRDYKLIYGEQYYLIDPATVATEWWKPQESPGLPDITGDDCHRIIDGKRVVRCLFNVIDDPSEQHNLYDDEPEIVAMLIDKIQAAREEAVLPVYHNTLGITPMTTQDFGPYKIPRHDYCTPAIHFALEPTLEECYMEGP